MTKEAYQRGGYQRGTDTGANRITVFRLACFKPGIARRLGKGDEREGVDWFSSTVWGESKTVRLVACYRRHVAILLFPSPFTARVSFTHARICARQGLTTRYTSTRRTTCVQREFLLIKIKIN